MANSTTIAISIAIRLGIWFAIIIAPIQASMTAVCALVLCDLVTGVWAAVKRGEKFTSWGLRKTASKILAYELAIVLAYVMESAFLPSLPVVKGIAGFIAATEFKSNLENLSRITGLDLWQAVRGFIQGSKNNPEKKDADDVDRPSQNDNRAP